MQDFNLEVFHFFNDLAHNHFVENFVKVFVDLPIFVLPIFLSGYWLYYSFSSHASVQKNPVAKKGDLLFIFYGTVLSLLISLTIQQFVSVDRPEEHMQAGAKLLLDHLPDASFPSDHATVSMAFLTGIFLSGYKKWFYVLVPAFVFMSISRVIAGVHWPFDIIAGTIVGIFGSYIVFQYISKVGFVKKVNMTIIDILKKIKL